MVVPRDYKVRTKPTMRPPHPGSVLRLDVLPALDIAVLQAARELGVSRQLLHGILAEKLPVSAEMAVRLGKWCGNGAHLWMAMQRDYDLWKAERKLADRLARIPTHQAS
jgi:addiction module HigA family antidote